jgi:Ca-activated chloride channel family protein
MWIRKTSMSLTSNSIIITLLAAVFVLTVPTNAQIKVSTQTVPLYVTVTDKDRRLIPGLIRDDFEVYDNDRLQTLTNFSNESAPITVVVMLDTSGSMTLSMDLVKQAAEQFFIRLLPEDAAKVGAFNDKLEVHPKPGLPFTNNRDQLIRLMKEELDFGYPTRLFDALDFSMEQLTGIDGRKVVVVFTDGEDTESKLSSGDVLERARQQEVMIYTVGMENEYFDGQRKVRVRPDRALRRLSDETGGGHFVLRLNEQNQLGATFTQVAQELHSQYVLGFTPQVLDNKVHKLEVRVKRPGATARSRKSYLASPTTAASGR